ncbi:hypothetical protein B1M_19474, partial [Burkholderia sp. TJI49]
MIAAKARWRPALAAASTGEGTMQKDHLALHPAPAAPAASGAPAVTRRGAIAAAVIGNWL